MVLSAHDLGKLANDSSDGNLERLRRAEQGVAARRLLVGARGQSFPVIDVMINSQEPVRVRVYKDGADQPAPRMEIPMKAVENADPFLMEELLSCQTALCVA